MEPAQDTTELPATEPPVSPPPEEDSHAIAQQVSAALEEQDIDTVRSLVEPLHEADIADVFHQLDTTERGELATVLGEGFNHDILPHLRPEAVEDVLGAIGVDACAEALTNLETDDAVHVIEEMDEDERTRVLEALEDAEYREELRAGLAFPEDSAGRLMRRALVSVPEYWTVGDTIDHMRQLEDDLPDDFYAVYVTDPRYRPVGTVLLGKIMQNKRAVKIADIMNGDVHPIQSDTDQEEVGHLFRKYGLVEAPVVSMSGRLIGTITVDDVVEVIQEEQEEDFLLSGGVTSDDLESGPFE
ncbi:MAG: magnesium transporter, partial [Oricola sp.]|nr:magnesium transporter [Oricola sp.]